MSKLYEETQISEPPKEDDTYLAIKHNGKKVLLIFQTGSWYGDDGIEFYSVDLTKYTHYLRPVEGNVLTDEELEALKKENEALRKLVERAANANVGRPSQLIEQFELFQKQCQQVLSQSSKPPTP